MIKNKEYIEKSIDGWFEPLGMELFDRINTIQHNLAIHGDITEIGVFHGKSACVLGQFLRDDESMTVVDTFLGYSEDDDFEKVFRDHYAYVVGGPVNVMVEKSQDIKAKDLPQNCRIFHIDGDHSYETTYHDMKLAQKTLVNGGIMILDDFLNQDWLGVSQAVNAFLDTYKEWCIVAYGWNKTILCETFWWENYYNQIKATDLPKSANVFQNPFHGYNWVSLKG